MQEVQITQGDIERFERACQGLARRDYVVENPFRGAYVISPDSQRVGGQGKSVRLTLMALTHGNEVGGVRVLCEVLEYLCCCTHKVSFSVCFLLGNLAAAAKNERYMESDLNRSFGKSQPKTSEEHRARQLESLLIDTQYLIDLHQTLQPSPNPFFIFPYTPASYNFARSVHGGVPIVTHWHGSFSADGMCTDEFVNLKGGCGISVELGQNGSEFFKVAAGFQICVQALNLLNTPDEALATTSYYQPEIYTWGQTIKWTAVDTSLDPGWYNFKVVIKGQRLGQSQGVPLIADITGPVLFPKYPYPGQIPPREVIRILRRVDEHELANI